MRHKLLLTLSLTAVLCSSCSDRHEAYGQFEPVGAKGWAYGDSLLFTPCGLDTAATGRKLSIAVRHDADYPYRNLALEISYRNGGRTCRDTVDMELADSYGSWRGNGLGPQRQIEAVVAQGVRIPDSSLIKVRHVMRVDTLRGVSEIGVLIENP